MSNPRLSVILTTCGRWDLLRQAAQSVRSQDYKDLELLIVIDLERVSRLSLPRDVGDLADTLIWCGDEGTKRIGACVNAGLNEAQGEFVTYLCDDDLYLSGKLTRMMTAVDQGADWVIDQVRWIRPDGHRLAQARLGKYMYTLPLEDGHEVLVAALEPSGVNWIAHDCSLHRATDDRWPVDAEHRTPVDWRFWCQLWKRGFRPMVQTDVGAEAFIPGSWRDCGLTVEKAMRARATGDFHNFKGGFKMAKRKKKLWAINTSGKQQNVIHNGGKIKVPDGGRIERHMVISTGPSGVPRMYDGFEPWRDVPVPGLPPKEPVKTVEQAPVVVREPEKVTGVEPVEEPESALEKDRLVPPIEGDTVLEKSFPSRAELEEMSYGEIQGLAKEGGVKRLNRKKAVLINAVLKLRMKGPGSFDRGTTTSRDIAH